MEWDIPIEGLNLRHRLLVGQGTVGSPQQEEEIRARVAACFLVDHLPATALPELLDSLVEMYEFYIPRTAHADSPPLIENASVPTTLGSETPRPVYPVTEE